MLADMGTKALPENPFVKFRDCMNGYALVKSAYPELKMSPLIYSGETSSVIVGLTRVQQIVMELGPCFTDDEI